MKFALLSILLAASAVAQTPVTVTGTATATSTQVVISIPSQNITIAVPAAPPPTCTTPQPATTTATVACPTGDTGSWTQTTSYAAAAYPTCWTPIKAPTGPPAGACTPIVTPPPTTGISWVYYSGVFNWGGDWSFAATPNYTDTSGVPIEGTYDIEITNTQWGGWQPYFNANCQSNSADCFNTTPYNYLIFSAKPSVANQIFKADVLSEGDTADGIGLMDLGTYCSGGDNPPIGQWETCKIPLSAFKLTDPIILKFAIGDNTGLSSNHWWLDNVGFSP
jgi:hypothetical protein